MRNGLQEFPTNQERVRDVILEYSERFPGIHENYTLVLLLVIKKFLKENHIATEADLLDLAARGRLPNLTSVHRALTLVKKEFQTARQAEVSEDLDDAWRQMLGSGGHA